MKLFHGTAFAEEIQRDGFRISPAEGVDTLIALLYT